MQIGVVGGSDFVKVNEQLDGKGGPPCLTSINAMPIDRKLFLLKKFACRSCHLHYVYAASLDFSAGYV